MTESILIHNLSIEEFKTLLNVVNSFYDIPEIEINSKQAQIILGCTYKTLMVYVDKNHLKNIGTKRPSFSLKEVIELKQSSLKYKRFSNLK